MSRALASLLLCLSLPVLAADAGWLAPVGKISGQHEQLAFGGTARDYLVQPAEGSGPFPVVILLHGGTQTMDQIWRQTTLPQLAKREHFILVAPQGLGKHWNDGRGATLAGDAASTADDVGFLHALIGEVANRYHGDTGAVFMTGVSNGGFMTMHYACERAQDLRAAASVIANLPADARASCHPAKPLPWLAINGMRDPIIPFAGEAATTKRGQSQPALLSADASFDFWADNAGCAKTTARARIVGAKAGDDAEVRTRTGCAGGAQSVQYALTAAGHSWPGMRNGLIVRVLGGSSTAIEGGETVWGFFQSTLPR